MGMKEPSADARNRLLLDVTGASQAKAASGRKLQRKRLKKEKTPQGRLFFIFILEGQKGALLIPTRWLQAACRRRRTPRGRYR